MAGFVSHYSLVDVLTLRSSTMLVFEIRYFCLKQLHDILCLFSCCVVVSNCRHLLHDLRRHQAQVVAPPPVFSGSRCVHGCSCHSGGGGFKLQVQHRSHPENTSSRVPAVCLVVNNQNTISNAAECLRVKKNLNFATSKVKKNVI